MSDLIALDYDQRREKIIALFKDGISLRNIAMRFGITYERVRQILRKAGVSPEEGGGKKIIALKRMAKEEARDRRYVAKWGCTFDDFKKIAKYGREAMRNDVGGSLRMPTTAFAEQRRNAKQQGVEWDPNFKFYDWWRLWHLSGRWTERRQGLYGMVRIDTKKPISKGNVMIDIISRPVRIKDGRDKVVYVRETKKGSVYIAVAIDGPKRTHLGSFSSREAAYAALSRFKF